MSVFLKEGNRISDITLVDCWGYPVIAPELDDNKAYPVLLFTQLKELNYLRQLKKIWF